MSGTAGRLVEITRGDGRWVARDEEGVLVGEGSSKVDLVRVVTERMRASDEVATVRVFAANGQFLEQRMYPRGEARRRAPRHS
jgi:hypothetical protein